MDGCSYMHEYWTAEHPLVLRDRHGKHLKNDCTALLHLGVSHCAVTVFACLCICKKLKKTSAAVRVGVVSCFLPFCLLVCTEMRKTGRWKLL